MYKLVLLFNNTLPSLFRNQTDRPGAELSAFNIYLSGQPLPYTPDWYHYAIYNDPTWNLEHLSLADVAYATQLNPFNIFTFDVDLSSFQALGGKILTYHGMQDQIITPDNSERYYKKLSAITSLPPANLDLFYRYFRISGMGHCSSGPGTSGKCTAQTSVGSIPRQRAAGDGAVVGGGSCARVCERNQVCQ